MTTDVKSRDTQKVSMADTIVGKSEAICNLREMIKRVAGSSASVMISGPSGSGKELVAQAIHNLSERSSKDYVALNCGAIPSELMESELFGHERGSFTGASTRRIGRFEQADKGTLFLDEIGDMRYDMEVKLLRVLEDGKICRVGSTASKPVDVRIISATHQNIDAAILENRFREDLYFRLGVVILRVPALAERTEDIPLLVKHFQKGKPRGAIAQFGDAAMARLKQHDWPGNVRELRNVVERAGILFSGQRLSAGDVDLLLNQAMPGLMTGKSLRDRHLEGDSVPKSAISTPDSITPAKAKPEPFVIETPEVEKPQIDADAPINLKDYLEQIELERIRQALGNADGVISEAARLLTLKRTTLIEKMRKYGVERHA